MNRTYRLIWSERLRAFIVAAENARSRSKASGLKALSALLLLVEAMSAQALPEGGTVSAGSGSVQTIGSTVTVNQISNNLVINWAKFGTTAGESVAFNQPGTSSIALNRVTGSEPSVLSGSLTANGQVWLLNPNGVQVQSGATITVGGWLASTLNISDADFMNGTYVFTGQAGSVTNKGNITVTDGGYVALLGGRVSNEGTIMARLGTVALAAGSTLTLDFAGDKLLNVAVNEGVASALVQNKDRITAHGGQVLLTAKGVDALLTTVVNNEGVIRAQTVGTAQGRIVLLGGMDGGVTKVSGTLDASAPDGSNGGFIETSGATVQIADGAQVTSKASTGFSGIWRTQTNQYTIAASGGNISGAQLSAGLNENNVIISTAAGSSASGNGDIVVNDAVQWNAKTMLHLQTLAAESDIRVNADISAESTAAGLILRPGTLGSYTLNQGARINLKEGALLQIAGSDYTVINTVEKLQAMQQAPGSHYALGSDIDANAFAFTSVGAVAGANFTGVLDGLGHQVSKLTINQPGAENVGLISNNKGTVRNIGLVDVQVQGSSVTGGLVGYNAGTVSNAYVTGSVSGGSETGGLVGYNLGSISTAYASGSVSGSSSTGGLVGTNASGGTIRNAYARSVVSGGTDTGGLVGTNLLTGSIIENVYALATVTGSTGSSGGLVGANSVNGRINDAYASGTVNGSALTTALMVGQQNAIVTDSVLARDAAAMKTQTSFTGFDFVDTWRIYENFTEPLLRAFLRPVLVTADDVRKTYDGQSYALPVNGAQSSVDLALMQGTLAYVSPSSSTVVDAGTYGLGGLWSTSYDIRYGAGTLTIDPARLTVTANSASKTYDRLAYSGGNGVTIEGVVSGDSDPVGGTLSYLGTAQGAKNAGAYTITPDGLRSTSANYQLDFVNGTLTILPKALTASISGTPAKIYDGTTNARLASAQFQLDGLVAGESITVRDGVVAGTYASKDVGRAVPLSATLDSAQLSAADNTRLANYTMPVVATGSGKILPDTLRYQAPLQPAFYGRESRLTADATTAQSRADGAMLDCLLGDAWRPTAKPGTTLKCNSMRSARANGVPRLVQDPADSLVFKEMP